MIKYDNTQVVFSEVPDEVTLAINLTCCPHHCKGCHSSYLWEDYGEVLTEESLQRLIDSSNGITCVAFMGGDNDVEALFELNAFVHRAFPALKTCWYTGFDYTDEEFRMVSHRIFDFDYIKLGPYIEELGPLTSPTTNQVFLRKKTNNVFENITKQFFKSEAR